MFFTPKWLFLHHPSIKGNTVHTNYYLRDVQGNTLAIYESKRPVNNAPQDNISLKETIIYGSSRLGQYRPFKPASEKLRNNKKTALGQRIYEFSNHLGNVLVTLSDFKIPQTDGTYQSFVVSASDYYPFGMAMKERTYQNSEYRYGFNGQEQSDELDQNGNSYTAEFWQYSAVIGRRWNIDPIDKSWESSYLAFAGNPIWHVDPNGDDWYVGTEDGNNAEAIWLANDEAANKHFQGRQYLNLGDKLLREVVTTESRYFSFRENWNYYGSFSSAVGRLEDEWTADDSYLVVGTQAFGKGVTQSAPVYSLWAIGSGIIKGENPYGEKMDRTDILLESVSFLPVGKVVKWGKGLFKNLKGQLRTVLKGGDDAVELVYRGDARGPSELLADDGFLAWGDRDDLIAFTKNCSSRDFRFISTSEDVITGIAAARAAMESQNKPVGYIYKIIKGTDGIDNIAYHAERGVPHPFPKQLEITYVDKIPYNRITHYQTTDGLKQSKWKKMPKK